MSGQTSKRISRKCRLVSSISQVFKYITEKCYDSDVVHMFTEVFSQIYQAKINIFSGIEGISNIIVGEQYQLEIKILRKKDYFDLLKPEVIVDGSSMENPAIFTNDHMDIAYRR